MKMKSTTGETDKPLLLANHDEESVHPRGSSPLARGTRRRIPTGSLHCTVHPRLHGEHEVVDLIEPLDQRFIPASTGNKSCPSGTCALHSVHPRMHGEHGYPCMVEILGRPVHPRMHGEHVFPDHIHCEHSRFIPACTGNTMFHPPFCIRHVSGSSPVFGQVVLNKKIM